MGRDSRRVSALFVQKIELITTTIYLWLISLTASKELPILLLKLLEWVWQ